MADQFLIPISSTEKAVQDLYPKPWELNNPGQ